MKLKCAINLFLFVNFTCSILDQTSIDFKQEINNAASETAVKTMKLCRI
jgi:hypothetical protein